MLRRQADGLVRSLSALRPRRPAADIVAAAAVAPLNVEQRRAASGKQRPMCLSDRQNRRLTVRGQDVPVDDAFWDYVADERSVSEAATYKNNTENYIGTLKYPVGVIGPLRVNGEHAKKDYVVPMATHEGALLASYDRGAKAITEAGGVSVRIKGRCMPRAPVFLFRTIVDANDFYRYVSRADTQAAIAKCVTDATEHCTVTQLRVFQTDRKVHVSIGIDSEDAAGQNMVTYAGEAVLHFLKANYPDEIPEMYIEGGFNTGKRVSVLHTLLGKGHSVVADCVIPKDVVQRVLHTTPYRLQRFQKMHNRTNEFVGGISCTAHVANGLAALFIATGNDPACVAESQAAVTHFDINGVSPDLDMRESGLYASITLNSIIIASVGGGTQLPSFRAARSMMGVRTANELAEICAGVALAGELSFYAAMESGEFSSAHWSMTHKDSSS
eukprot:TRINITY_DN56113_c0_g1_i1.p1 TRINITY_DN56113_c0_g1~~TRINITY_DN56113_c0_g1_i1.p1  ORF type:complete len:442 (+),score=92.72 TRINITY_DN56113_c0_g1_i1:85-1410(+)